MIPRSNCPLSKATEDERASISPSSAPRPGYITLDDGYVNTGATTSAITFLDGEQGILRYRGYPIEQLAQNCDFIEVSYLLIYGELPTAEQLQKFRTTLRRHTMLHEDMRMFYNGFPRDAHPMAILSSVVGALSTFYQDSLDPHDQEQVDDSVIRLLAKLPTIAAFAYKKSIGQPFIYPRERSDLLRELPADDVRGAERAVRGRPRLRRRAEPAADRPRRPRAELQHVDRADGRFVERQPVRVDLGRHLRPVGTAARRGQRGLRRDARADSQATAATSRSTSTWPRTRTSSFRLMGFGHRVYKNFDPRATIIKAMCDKLLNKRQHRRPDLRHRPAAGGSRAQRSYFIERKLYPNVDFYSGVIYRAIGIPVPMFTVLFAIGRLPGWIAHWVEMHASPNKKICRPRQIYTGPTIRDFVPREQR